MSDVLDKVNEAKEQGLVSSDEFGFINSLINRFKSDIAKKERLVQQTLGEINQLKINLQIIKEMAVNIIAAEQRAKARRETAMKLRADREEAVKKKVEESVASRLKVSDDKIKPKQTDDRDDEPPLKLSKRKKKKKI